MVRDHILWKCLVCGIIVLFVGTSINPIAGGDLSIEKEQSVLSKSCSDGIILNGTMGQNGWYVSPVSITFEDELLYYVDIDEGGWSVYTEPIVVNTDGVHTVLWYSIDPWGVHSPIYNITFRIDQTPPTITIIKHRIGLFKYVFSFNCSDTTSGVVLIECYLDGELIGTVTTPPFEFIVTVGFRKHIVTVIAYDAAGLNGSDSGSNSYTQMDLQQSTLSNIPILPPIDRTYFVGKIHNLTIEGNDYHFESYNIRKIRFWRYNLRSWGFSFDHFIGHYSCGWGGAAFHGILTPDVICGYFTVLQ